MELVFAAQSVLNTFPFVNNSKKMDNNDMLCCIVCSMFTMDSMFTFDIVFTVDCV